MCTLALTYACVPKVFAGPEMEKNFSDSEMVGILVYVCVVPKSQAACIREQKYAQYFYSKQTQNTHLAYDNQMHRKKNKHLQVHSGGLKFLILFSKNTETTTERRACPDILISAFLP